MNPVFNWSYRKVGGLRFVKLGRFGFSFWVSRAGVECAVVAYRQRTQRATEPFTQAQLHAALRRHAQTMAAQQDR
jgi:hypothetical protein